MSLVPLLAEYWFELCCMFVYRPLPLLVHQVKALLVRLHLYLERRPANQYVLYLIILLESL